MSAKSTLIDLHFLPSIYYICVATRSGNTLLERWENYNKGSFRNKALISSNQNNQYLIVPLKKGKHRSQPIHEVEIYYDEDWIRPLGIRLQTEYGSLPYFGYYIEDIMGIIEQRTPYLFDLNTQLMLYIYRLLGLPIFSFTQAYLPQYPEKIRDLRNLITPRYLKTNPRLLSPIDVGYFTFTPGLSIIEALFTYGPETELLIRQYSLVLSSQNLENQSGDLNG